MRNAAELANWHAVINKEYVERWYHSFYLTGSRVPLAHVVRQFQLGSSPEAIRSYYPTLSLEQGHGAIMFYLGNKGEVELSAPLIHHPWR